MKFTRKNVLLVILLGLFLLIMLIAGYQSREDASKQVVVYTALDRMFSEPILQEFEKKTGIRVLARYDTEITKSVGLTAALIEEKQNPRCDVFWNNEILNTLRLKKRGVLQPYDSPAAKNIPSQYRDPKNYWTGFAARSRVLLVNTELVKPKEYPQSLFDLTQAKWQGKVGIAKPVAGTTATHVACLFAELGEDKAKEFLLALKANDVVIESGNKSCAQKVAAGELAMGLTDTDDAIIEIRDKQPVTMVYLDKNPSQMGTLFIPNTLGLIKNCPHPEAGQELIDFLLSPEVEKMLAQSASAQIPLNPKVEVTLPVKTPQEIHAMQVNLSQAVSYWEKAREFIVQSFLR